MSIVIGRRYSIDKEKLKEYCDNFGWRYKYMIFESVNVIREHNNDLVPGVIKNNNKNIKFYNIRENEGYYPEDCLIDIRELKLKKILR